MDIKDIMGKDIMEENNELHQEGLHQEEQNLEEHAAQPSNHHNKFAFKSKFKKKNLAIFALILLIIVALSVWFLFLKPKNNVSVLTGPGAPAIFPPTHESAPISLLNNTATPAHPKTVAPDANILSLKTNASSKDALKTNSSIVKKSKTAKKINNGNKLNDLFTVKYNKTAVNPLNPVSNSMPPPPPPMQANVPSFNNFKLPGFKNIAGKLKTLGSFKKIPTISVSGYAGGLVAASCGAGIKYLKTGNSICGWTLLRADNAQAVFAQGSQIKKIVY